MTCSVISFQQKTQSYHFNLLEDILGNDSLKITPQSILQNFVKTINKVGRYNLSNGKCAYSEALILKRLI
jgi:hypothetical protein